MDGASSLTGFTIVLATLGVLWTAFRPVVARSSPTLRRRGQRYRVAADTGPNADTASPDDGAGHHHGGWGDHAGDAGHGGDGGH